VTARSPRRGTVELRETVIRTRPCTDITSARCLA
jgi:hypothetical protein